jgi:hypothetical protein
VRPALTGPDIPQWSKPSCWPRSGARYSGLPPIQRLLGHNRITTTEMYLNLSREAVMRECP